MWGDQLTGSWSEEMKKVWRRLSPFLSWRRWKQLAAPGSKAGTRGQSCWEHKPIPTSLAQTIPFSVLEFKLLPHLNHGSSRTKFALRGTPSTKYISPRRSSWPTLVTNLRGYSGTWLRRISSTKKFGLSGFTLVFCSTTVLFNKTPSWKLFHNGLVSKGALLHYARIGVCFIEEEGLPSVKGVSVKNVRFQLLLVSTILKIFAPASPAWISAEHRRAYCKGSPYKEQPPPS